MNADVGGILGGLPDLGLHLSISCMRACLHSETPNREAGVQPPAPCSAFTTTCQNDEQKPLAFKSSHLTSRHTPVAGWLPVGPPDSRRDLRRAVRIPAVAAAHATH